MRKGSANTGRGAQRFVVETIGRVRRAGATGPLTLRADSGFWSAPVMDACTDHDVRFSLTVRRTKAVTVTIEQIPEHAWVAIDYTDRGDAEVAETTLAGRRLIPLGVFNANAAWLVLAALSPQHPALDRPARRPHRRRPRYRQDHPLAAADHPRPAHPSTATPPRSARPR
jgi:hypothetical protein